MNIGRALKFYRENANLTQGEIADKLGIKEEKYCSYEKDAMNMRLDTLSKFADLLGVEIVEILNKAEE